MNHYNHYGFFFYARLHTNIKTFTQLVQPTVTSNEQTSAQIGTTITTFLYLHFSQKTNHRNLTWDTTAMEHLSHIYCIDIVVVNPAAQAVLSITEWEIGSSIYTGFSERETDVRITCCMRVRRMYFELNVVLYDVL